MGGDSPDSPDNRGETVQTDRGEPGTGERDPCAKRATSGSLQQRRAVRRGSCHRVLPFIRPGNRPWESTYNSYIFRSCSYIFRSCLTRMSSSSSWEERSCSMSRRTTWNRNVHPCIG